MSGLPPADAPRIVRPRKSTPDWRPVIAVSRDLVVAENRDEDIFPAEDLGKILAGSPPSIIVCQGFGEHLQQLQQEWEWDPDFNYRVTPLRRYSRPWTDGRKLEQGMIVDTICNFVGWAPPEDENGKRKGKSLYHFPLDPLWFLTAGIDDINDDPNLPRVAKLYNWAREVRDWCHAQGVKVTPSSGGIAAQLLRDSRFYPEPRRKVPRGINDSVRHLLPGNYYHLPPTTKLRKPYRAIYLDMENAHHALTQRIVFPDANSLHAYGDFSYFIREEKNPSSNPRRWKHGSSSVLKRPGIFFVRLSVPTIPHSHFPPPFMARSGFFNVAVYSNELQLIESLGGKIEEVYAAIVSTGTDVGLKKYGRFAIDEIRGNRQYRPWLKPVLHSTYGLLAARPVAFETGYFRSKQPQNRVEYPMGNVSIPANARQNRRAVESRISNVIHRGMIEAEVRKNALMTARNLTELDSHRVLAIYADGIFIEDTGQLGDDPMRPLRLLEYPWRIKEQVSSLRFHSATTFTSSSLNRLPGIPRNARARYLSGRLQSREYGRRKISQIAGEPQRER